MAWVGWPTRLPGRASARSAHQVVVRGATSLALVWQALWLAVFVLWNIGTCAGALGAAALDDPATLGLDAAIPAGFVALLWPRLVDRTAWAVALAGAALALVLTPVLRPGLPVLAAGLVALAAAWLTGRARPARRPR